MDDSEVKKPIKYGGGHRICKKCNKTVFGSKLHICKKENKMSGGHYQYKYRVLEELSDEIECDFANDNYDTFIRQNPYKGLVLKDEVVDLIKDLRSVAKRAKELEWFMSGDTGVDSYFEGLKELRK